MGRRTATGGGSGGGDGDVHIGPRPRPRPDETKRVPKLCGTNEAKEESEFYKEASDCFEFNTLDWGKQQECLRLHGCPDDDRNRKQSPYCNDWCPRSKFFAPWSSKSWLQSCINTASASGLIIFLQKLTVLFQKWTQMLL